jgi:hypothetical protein
MTRAKGRRLSVHPFLIRSEAERAEHCGSFAGQAHFASTGPAGKCCGDCGHWLGTPRNRRAECEMFLRLMRVRSGPKVPRHAASCRHFAPAPQPKPLPLDEVPMPFGRHHGKPMREAARSPGRGA